LEKFQNCNQVNVLVEI